MSAFESRRLRRGLSLMLCAAALLVAPRAFASSADTTVVSLTPIRIQTEPVTPCNGDTVALVAVSPCYPCIEIGYFGPGPTGGLTVYYTQRSAAACSTLPCSVQRRRAPIGRLAAGHYEILVDIIGHVESDTVPAHDVIEQRRISFDVGRCEPNTLPFIERVVVGAIELCDTCPPQVCPNVPVVVAVEGRLPNPCWSYLGMEVLPILSPLDRPVVRVTVREPCPDPEVVCPPDSPKPFVDAISLPPQLPGRHEVELQLAPRRCIDSTAMQLYSKVFAYVVQDTCAPPPPPRACVWPFLEPRRQVTPVPPSGPCDLRLLPGGTGSLVFTARAEDVPLAGLQGQFGASDFLRIENLELVGPAAGMHLNWVHKNNGAAFVMFSDLGAPIPAGDWVSVLRVTVSAARPTTGTTMGEVYGSVTAASDSFGTSVGICPIMTLVMPAAHVCIGGPASCDANGDGVSNVADLVRMVLCMLRPWDCPDTLAARPDCTNDGEFHLDDLFCCARGMLGIPHDSSGVGPGDLSFTFGTPRMDGNILHVPLQVRGADRMGGALLRIDYPSDRWIAVDPTLTGPSSGPSWTPLLEVGSDDVLVGLLRLDTTAPGELSVPLDFRLRPGAQPGGQIRIGSSEISAADGTPIDLDLSSLVATLEPGSGSAPTHVALSPARPNPATGATSFAVSLPVAGEVDLAIYDLAGRRVATLWHGSLAAGNRSFTWQPEGVPSGMYFARLSVNGEVRSSRVALKLGR